MRFVGLLLILLGILLGYELVYKGDSFGSLLSNLESFFGIGSSSSSGNSGNGNLNQSQGGNGIQGDQAAGPGGTQSASGTGGKYVSY